MEQRFSQEPRLSTHRRSQRSRVTRMRASGEWLERKGAHGPARRLTITNANGRDELIYLLLIDWPLVAGASRRCEPGRISKGAEEGRGGRSEQYRRRREGERWGGRLLFAEFTADRSINLFHLSRRGRGRGREGEIEGQTVLLKRRN